MCFCFSVTGSHVLRSMEDKMVRLAALAFFVAFVSSAQAIPLAPVQQPESIISTIREACGAGMHRVNGVCIRTPARRQAARCAAGYGTSTVAAFDKGCT